MYEFIDNSPTCYHAVKNMADILEKNGFKKLNLKEKWNLNLKDKVYVIAKNGSIVAVELGNKEPWKDSTTIIASHSDSPGFKVKSNYLIKKEGNYKLINTEVYGSPLYYTWLDRPLKLAGQVIIKNKDNIETKLVNGDNLKLIIPSLAIHMNREANSGFTFNPQKHLLPVITIDETQEDKDYIKDALTKELNIKKEDILDYDLFIVADTKHSILGNGKLVASQRLDNLSMAYTSLKALVESKQSQKTKVFVCYNHEEIGSNTAQGADSPMLANILERIILSLGYGREEYLTTLENSFLVSADLAHALHPTMNDMADPTNRPILGKGLVIKHSARGSYITEGKSSAYFKAICQKHNLQYQEFANASDQRGGSTVGPLTLSYMDIYGIDVGSPILGMHSICETGAVEDFKNAKEIFQAIYEENTIKLN